MIEPEPGAGDRVDALWLAALQRFVDRAAHGIRNPLNGAALNLEVVRARLLRASPAPDALAPHVQAAASELAAAIDRIEPVLRLARTAPSPIDLAETLRHLLSLRSVPEGAAGEDAPGGSEWRIAGGASAESSVDANAARLVLAAAVEAATGRAVRCTIRTRNGRVLMDVQADGGLELPAAVRDAGRAAGVDIRRHQQGILLVFPSLQRGDGVTER